MHFIPISRHPRLSPRHRSISCCVIWPPLLTIMHAVHHPNSASCWDVWHDIMGAQTLTQLAADDFSPVSLLQGNQRSLWVINGFKLLPKWSSHQPQYYWNPKQMVVNTGDSDEGERKREEWSISWMMKVWADACLICIAGIKCSRRLYQILWTEWLGHSCICCQ